MFNTFIENRFPNTIDVKVGIKEVKAPTDESIRLLNEFEEKAKKNLIEKISFATPSNSINGDIYMFQSPASREYEIAAVFKLNDVLFDVRHKTREMLTREKLIKIIYEDLVRSIYTQLTINID